jgi:hypothetical protein
MRVTPINEAEAVIEPFWDEQLNGLNQWVIDSGTEHGLYVRQTWCSMQFGWSRRPATAPALRMRRPCGIDCSGYDRLVLSVMVPEQAVLRIVAETDRGIRQLQAPPAGTKKAELLLELDGATRLEAVTIEVDAAADGIATGWFNWLGLQHRSLLAGKLTRQSPWDARWENYLQDEAFTPQFTPRYGLVLNADELAVLRTRHDELVAAGKTSPFVAAANAAQVTPPEDMINDFVNFWGDSRYNRVRDHDKYILTHGLNAAIAGHLLQDKHLLRLAARYAMSIGMCGKWDDGFICFFPGSTFEHRCFVQSLCAYEVAGILDLAGEYFTDLGREFLLRRLAEEAIGFIQYTTWRYDYIFTCNQLSWFTPGRMLAMGVLSRHWPRVLPYMDIAYRELCESLDNTILPDGGYVEGPTYFRCVGRDAGLSVYYYSRTLGKPMEELIPPAMRQCADFGEAIISTDDNTDVVPICDARNQHEIISQAIMASLLPNSAWSRMLHKALTHNMGWPVHITDTTEIVPMMADSAIAWGLSAVLPSTVQTLHPLVILPDMGPCVSHRKYDGHWVKLFIQGNPAGAGHTHEDKGSFVLEFAGDTFAMDPGTCDYSHPLSTILKYCERHNMLIPYGIPERPAPESPLPIDVKAYGHGDETMLHVEIDAMPGWEPYYRRWRRTWDSPTPDVLTITDDYELASGDGVEFCWQTQLPVTVDGATAILMGRRGHVVLQAPTGCAWRVDELPLLAGVQYRLVARHAARAGKFTICARLVCNAETEG